MTVGVIISKGVDASTTQAHDHHYNKGTAEKLDHSAVAIVNVLLDVLLRSVQSIGAKCFFGQVCPHGNGHFSS